MSLSVDMKAAGFWLKTQGKPEKIQGRKATGPRFLREAMDDIPKDPRSPGCRSGFFIADPQSGDCYVGVR